MGRSSPSDRVATHSGLFFSCAAIVIAAFVFGGGGVRYGAANLVVQLIALLALAFNREAAFNFWNDASGALRWLIGLTVALPLLQLVPIPQSFWAVLPGRELWLQSFELTGRSEWAAMSADPIRTALAASGLIAPLVIVFCGLALRRSQVFVIGWMIVAFGVLNFLIGIVQVTSNGSALAIYSGPSQADALRGLFANRNSTGLFFVSAITLCAFLPLPKQIPAAGPLRTVLIVTLTVGVVLTGSRTALVLCAIPFVLVALKAILTARSANRRSRLAIFASLFVAFGIGASALIVGPGRIADTTQRFTQTDEARAYIWEDALYSANRYWPIGSGAGTFDEVYQVDESLENLTQRRAGRAHNDYLEIAIEAGAVGLALIVMWLAFIGWLCWRARHAPMRWIAWSGGAILLGIALQSFTDYPLRNQAMLVLASFALVLLARFAKPIPEASTPEAAQ